MPALRLSALCLAALLLYPTVGAAQERTCNLIESGTVRKDDGGLYPVIVFEDPFVFRCSDGAELRADRGRLNEGTRELELTGNVFFEDPLRTLTADHATYTSTTARLYATGDVVFTDRVQGSTIEGPELEYYRVTETRPEPHVVASRRPHLLLQPREEREDAEPLELDADRVDIFGNDELHALGRVVIESGDVTATAAEARYDGAVEQLVLRREARIRNDDFTLSGDTVEARLAESALEHVHARGSASLSGDELTVDAPDLQLFFASDLLQRAVGQGIPGDSLRQSERVFARSEAFRLEADSLEALLPDQSLDVIVAIGNARAEAVDTTSADTTTVALADTAAPTAPPALALVRHDWLEGDTIRGFFAPADSTAQPDASNARAERSGVELQRLVASGTARSLYRMRGEDANNEAQAFNYLAGQIIELAFGSGELEVAQVTGLRTGLHLSPVREQNRPTDSPPDPDLVAEPSPADVAEGEAR